MRAVIFFVACSATAVWAAPYKGKVLKEGVAAAGIEVRAWGQTSPFPDCPPTKRNVTFGRCLCPEGEQAFGTLLRKRPEIDVQPIARATTGADGSFTLELASAAAGLTASSPDGKWVAEGITTYPRDLELQPARPLRLRFTGLTQGLAAYAVSTAGGRVERLEERGGVWTSRPVSSGSWLIVVAAQGAQTSMQMLIGGRPMSSMGMFNDPEDVGSIELTAALPMTGVVTDNGRPAADVEVIADPEGCATTTRTNAAGEFKFAQSNARPYLTPVVARTKRRFAQVDASAGASVALALGELARLELTVVDETGAPVPGLWLTLKGKLQQSLHTDPEGKVSVELEARDATLEVPEPWLVRDPAPFFVKGTLKKSVVIERGAVIVGRLVDPHGGKPGKVAIEAKPIGSSDVFASRHGWTDEQGLFKLQGLRPGRYVLSIFGNDEAKVEVAAPGEVELSAEVAHAITGRVVDKDGKPLKRASISARAKDRGNRGYGGSTDEKGEFTMRVGALGTYELTFGHGASPKKQVTLEVGEKAGPALTVELARLPALVGRVTAADGTPMAGEQVEAIVAGMLHLRVVEGSDPSSQVMMAKASRLYASAVSGADGAFELALHMPATVFVSRGAWGSSAVTATPGKPVTVVMKQRPVATGRVVDPSGRPVSHFRVNQQEMFDADGRFTVPLFKTGAVEVVVFSDSSPDEQRTVDVGADAMSVEIPQIQLRRGFTVGGTALDAITGKPAKAGIDVLHAVTGASLGRAMVQHDGTFELNKLAQVPLRLKFDAQDYVAASVTAKAGQRDVKVKLVPRASIELTVRKHGEAGKGVEVRLQGAAGFSRNTFADSDGRAEFQNVDPGAYSLHTVDFGNQGPPTKVVLKPGAKVTADLATQ